MHVKSLRRPTRWRHSPHGVDRCQPRRRLIIPEQWWKETAQKYKKTRQRFLETLHGEEDKLMKRYQKTGVRPKHRGCSKGERRQKLALPPCDTCRPIKKWPARILDCLDGRGCFLSVCCDVVNHNAVTTSKLEDTFHLRCCGPATELSFFFISLCILNSQFFHQSLGHDFTPAVGDLATS